MVSAKGSLQQLAAWWVTQIPRQPPSQAAGPAEGDLLAIQRLAALTSAYQAGGPVAFGWFRQLAGGPVQVLVAGAALAAGPDGGYALLTLPSGGRGEATDGESAVAALEQLSCWGRIGAIADGLLASQTPPSALARAVRPSLDDGLLAAWPGPFGWLLLAEPVGAAELAELIQSVSIAQGIEQKYDNPKAQLKARRLEQRHAELRQCTATGCGTFTCSLGRPRLRRPPASPAWCAPRRT